MFWTASILLLLFALLFLLVPLWRRREAEAFGSEQLRRAANIALFHERSDELEKEFAAGNIDQGQFDKLMQELQQTLLADVSDYSDSVAAELRATPQSGPSRSSLLIPVLLAVLVPIAAYLIYQQVGAFEEVAHRDLYERTLNNANDAEEAQRLIVALGEVVQSNEELPWAWYFLAENFASLGLFGEAQIAYRRAADLLAEVPDKALVLGRVALAMYVLNDLEMTPEIMAVIDEARGINANEVSVLQLLAADAEQNQNWDKAIEYWRLLIQVNPNAPQAQTLRQNIAQAQQRLNGEEVSAGPVVEVSLSLAPELEVDAGLRVFVAARNAEREGMPPLAAAVLTVADLPTSIRLDNSSAVGPFNLASAESVYVTALISNAGIANPASGDWRAVSASLRLGQEPARIELLISEQVP